MVKYFIADNIYHNGRFYPDSALAVDDEGYVIGLLPLSYVRKEPNVTDFGERILAPGWVDLQLNGCGGGLFNRDLDLPCLEKMLCNSLGNGTTSAQPTLITCCDKDILEALEVVHQAQKKGQEKDHRERQLWQTLMGMHLEGPYISVERRGAHPERFIRPLDEAMLQKLEAAGRAGILSYITVASQSVSPYQVARLTASGLTVSLGHSEAPIDDLRAMLLAGARCFTHLYNAMGSLNSRDPHTLSLALGDERAYSSIIADGYHVASENIRIARQLLGERLFLVTDATASGTADGVEQKIFFGEQICRIEGDIIHNEEGAMAGSALTMKRGVEILSDLFGLEVALGMASINPVRALNPQNSKNKGIGSFAPGSKANFVVFDFVHKNTWSKSQISSLETWVLGRCWEAE